MNDKTNTNQPAKVEILVDDNVQNIFTDIIEISASMEAVSMEIAVRNKDGKTAKASHNLIMTIPHFMRFTEVCSNLARQMNEKFEELKKQQK